MAPVVKPKMKVAPERRGMKKIWNVSDWAATSVPAQTVMVMGVAVPPGGAVEVPEARLKNAHKTMKDRDAGLLHIGEKPPAEYMASKGTAPRARVPRGVNRTHGRTSPMPAAVEEAPEVVEEAAVVAEAPAEALVEAAPVEAAPAEEPKEEELRNGFVEKPEEGNGGKHGNGGRRGRR